MWVVEMRATGQPHTANLDTCTTEQAFDDLLHCYLAIIEAALRYVQYEVWISTYLAVLYNYCAWKFETLAFHTTTYSRMCGFSSLFSFQNYMISLPSGGTSGASAQPWNKIKGLSFQGTSQRSPLPSKEFLAACHT